MKDSMAKKEIIFDAGLVQVPSEKVGDDISVQKLNLLSEAERTLLLETWNATETVYPDQLGIHQLFERQVEKKPTATALIAGDKVLSYAELNARANRLTHQLIKQGISPNDHVAILLERSIELVVAQLAILKAGAVYVPIDPGAPNERKDWLINDCLAKLLLIGAEVDIPADLDVPLIRLSDETDVSKEEEGFNPDLLCSSTAPAYIMYTSGSTGTPKGVIVPHRAVVRLVINNSYVEIAPNDRVAFAANPAFDASTFEVWAPLLNGGALVVIDHTTLLTPQEFVQALDRYQINILWLSVGLFNRLAAELSPVLPQMKNLIVGGDILDPHVIAQVLCKSPPQQLLNAYGPTEGTTFTTTYRIDALAAGTTNIPIGRPIANTRVYLLDEQGQPVPLGKVGEIYVGGDGVACGYLNRPELTTERFVVDPFSDAPDARMYRTGDLARYLPDGNLEFLGRNDQQVKIRGFRIEPGEIEACLVEYPTVREAVVLALGEGQNKQLVAYVLAESDNELPTHLREHLSARLPDYMVPVAFVRLDEFPLTPNGKLDRRALPTPGEDAFARQVYAAPQGEREIALVTIWRELLGIEQISRHDSFFALGGHSLLGIRMIEQLRHLGLTLSARDLFQSPILAELAQTLGQHQIVAVPPNVITPTTTELTPAMLPLIDLTQPDIDHIVEQVPGGGVNIQDIYALSPLQDGILFHHLLAKEGDPYLLAYPMIFADRGLLDRYLFAVQQVVDRHDILRTAFIWQGLSIPAQVVWRQALLSVTELTLNPADGPVSDQLAQRFDPRQHRFDLSQAPLLRFVIAQQTDGRWYVLQLQHHLIGDHTTLEVMNREVRAYLDGQDDNLSVPVPFRNLVAQARQGVDQTEPHRFFTDMLAEVDEPTLPFGLTEVHRDGSQVAQAHRMLSPTLNDRLRAQARRLGVSLATLCHQAWAQVLSRTSGQEKVVFGTVLFGRMAAGEGADNGMGLFINTLPLRLDIDDTPVQDSVRVAHTRLAGLLDYEHASLALAQRCSGVQGGTPLFSALLNYRHNEQPMIPHEAMPGIEFLGEQERTNYPFVLSVEDGGTTLGLTAQVVQPFDSERVCGYMQQALESLVDALELAPETPVRELNVLPASERTLLLENWNATETPYPEQLCIHQLIEQQAEKTPEAAALVYENQTLSYGQLNADANRLAHQLLALGIVPDQRVAICMTSSPARVIAVLAVLKAGGAYVPLDPAYPGERLLHILTDAAPAGLKTIVLVDSTGRAALGEQTLAELTVLDPNILPDQPDGNPQVPALTSRHLAYVIYTSGSTGTPKGVMIEHRGLVNLIRDKISQFDIRPVSRMLQFASFGFDAGVWEIMMALGSGACLVIPAETVRQDPRRLWHYLEEQSVTHACLTPALLREGADLPTITIKPTLILGGEAPSPVLLRALSHQATLFNAYGPTEITVCATNWRCPSHYTDVLVPIGRPTANTRLYLLDNHGQPVPLGAVGELYIGGDGVARGYLNRPDLTDERFLADPFSDAADARMYRTGDLVRYLPDGNLVFVGRSDQQIKIRGFRIEPGEIEARLAEHPMVREARVVVLGDGPDKRLIAYVVAEADSGLAASLHTHLSAMLPDYMVPAAFVRLAAFPLTPNGKLDHRALPAPGEDAFAHQIYVAPQGEMEIAVAAIWRELLGVEQIGRHDNFFALGGHSLLAVRMMNRIAVFGVDLPLATLFMFPSLSAFTEKICAQRHAANDKLPAIRPISRDSVLPLSFGQQRLWFLAQFEGVSDTYHVPTALRLRGRLNLSAWQQALNRLFARHEALRSVFITVDGQPQVELLPAEFGLPVKKYDLRKASNVDEQFKRLCVQEAKTPFDLARGPLIRCALIQLADEEHIFLLTQHHIISDAWSLKIFESELVALYAAGLNQQPDPLPRLTIQYPDYAAWQRQVFSGEGVQAQSDYWHRTLADAPVLLELPIDRPRPFQQSFTGGRVAVHIDAPLVQALKHLGQQHGTTLFMTLLTAWAALLSRLSGQDDVVIGIPSANRNLREIEPLLGFFVNTLALRIDLSGMPDVVTLLRRVRQTTLGAQEHQDLPFEQVVEIVQPPRRPEHTPLFQVMFAWQESETEEWQLPDLTVTPFELGYDIAKFDLQLELTEKAGEIVGELNYSSALFDHETIERQVGYLQAILRAIVNQPQQLVTAIDILSSAERELLLENLNATKEPYPTQLCVHQLFEQQAEKTPDAIAVIYENQTLSYAELNIRANRLAHQLIALGVAPDQRVAICVTRSLARIIGLLAVLKAGGAYVPLDPAYPGERLAYMLTDATPVILMADNVGRAALSEDILATLTVLDPNTLSEQPDSNPQVSGLTSQHLAYVIYTSGSTGRPKGVMIEHRSVVNLTLTQITQFDFCATSRMLQFASFGFDASIWEIMIALNCGAMLVIPTETVRQDPQRLWHYLEEQAVTHACLTPAMFHDGADLPTIAVKPTLIFAGEAPSAALFQALCSRADLFNAYGPTETTVCATTWDCPADYTGGVIPIGSPAANKRLYLLDEHRQPVPLGTVGELYIGGVGVARGYLNRPELTAERFLNDPFSDEADARMYRTGDLARYLPDGNLVFVGRNDQQVKIRGFRIESGEIEARLIEHSEVSEALVLALGDGLDKRLVAYVVAPADNELATRLREYLSDILPDYMIPAAFVCLDAFPLTPNGKLDRRSLPAPGEAAFARQAYQAPQGEIEIALATIWRELLNVEQIGRHDSFFALGGHSLLAVRMIELLRRIGLGLSVQTLFQHPTLSVLAQSLAQHREISVPDNRITVDTTVLTPAMLPLIDLTQAEIDRIVEQVPGGIANIQDIYALSPLQDGILFHHLLANEGDPYLLITQQAFADRPLLDRYLAAVQQVVNRHDILRTAFIWGGLSVPAQVVCRQAPLSVTELMLDPANGPISDQLAQRFDPRRHRIDLNQAPLLRFVVAQESDGRWIVLQLLHHLIGDHTTLEVMNNEVQACLLGQIDSLPAPVPFRHLVAQARQGVSQAEHTHFFTDMLAEVDEPTLPFGLAEAHHDGSQVTESHRMLTAELNDRLRGQARRLGVSVAALCHLAWAQVLSRTSGRQQVVFGTVLFGRMQAGEGFDSGMGLFINTLPLRLDIDNTPVRDSVRTAHSRLAGLLEHEHASLALAQRCSGVASGTPLFNALLNYRHNTRPVTPDEIMSGIEFLGAQERTNYPFVLSVEDGGADLGLTAQVVQPFDPERICGYMQQALASLVDSLERTPDMPVQQLDILPTTERTLLLKTWNATETAYPERLCIHQLFEQQVEKTPDATALECEERSLSYAELNTDANRLAHQLIALGVAPDQRVAICVASSPARIVALLAVLKAGGAYVPLDPAYPGERLAHILTDAEPIILLADSVGRSALGEQMLAGQTLLDPNSLPDQPDSNPQLPTLTARHLAYVIYTSGSTGTPKGVMVEHHGLVNLIQDKIARFDIFPASRMLQFASFGFDASVWETMMALCSGATLDIPVDTIRQDPNLLWHYLEAHAVTHACLTPALLRDGADLPAITIKPTLILGGEAPSAALLKALCGKATVFNAYGPTEITVCATSWRCPSNYSSYSNCGDELIPIGRPTANTCIYLLDALGQLVPLGAVGELYIGGAGVARGYLNRSELTDERFLTDPFSEIADARMYRTGDLARYLPDGNLVFVGRNDQQIKIRGFRIEPGEIETRLTEHPAVREALVLALGDGQDKRLVAYVAAAEDDGLVNHLREHLSGLLPDYMVPAAFVRLEAFPLTPNGKLDRRALPAPGEEAFARQIYAAPQGETETVLAAIWRELLGIEQIGRYDSFFALGGHSLLAVRMVERLRNLGLTLAVRDLFQSPVLSELAQTLTLNQVEKVPVNVITPATTVLTPAMLPLIDLTQSEIDHIVEQVPGGIANIQDIYALSPLQDGILFHHLLANEGDPYLLAGQMAFADRKLLDRYLVAVQQVINRHDILRTAFIWQGLSVPAQVVYRQVRLSVTELTLDPADGPISDQLTQRFNPRQYRLDLGQAPLLRFVVAQESDGRWIVLQLMHHLIGDHTALDVMSHEVQAYLDGQESSLPAPAPFRNLVAQSRLGMSQAEHTRFFTEMLAEVTEPTLPFGLTEVRHDGSQMVESHRMLTPELNDSLRGQARRLGVSLAALCHLAWAQVLSRTSGQRQVVFGTVLFGRMAAGEGAENGMGLFINTLPLCLNMNDTSVRDSVQVAHNRLAGLLEHEYASLALAQRCSGVQGGTPLFSTLLNYRHNASSATSNEIMSGVEFLGAQERTNYPFTLSVEDFGDALGLTAQIVQPFDAERVCGYMQQALESLAAALEHAPETPVRQLEVLPAVERKLLLKIGNGPQTAYSDPLCIHHLFEQQVANNPAATALVYEEQTFSYAELNACANRLAHQLIELGVEPDQRVAICITRSPSRVVALLAVLKAGGAYVPLDPSYPGDRLAYMLTDAAPSVVLVDNAGRTALGEQALAALTVLDPTILPDQPDSNPHVPALTSRHLAYVIYTSGSTGTPKGVMVEHCGLVNLIRDKITQFDIRADSRLLQFASFGFDASVWEIMMALCGGATLDIPVDTVRQDPLRLWRYLEQRRVTHACLTPALLRDGADLPAITIKPTLILGGEAPGAALLQALRGRATLFNAYGPTEITVCATCWRCPSDYTDVLIPIGHPTANTRIYLLDNHGQSVPFGAVGELYIGGAGVARGYLNRPDLTAERFLVDPFSDQPDARMYRTGDLARYLPDGNLVFVGRNDQQIKIRGFRIEPGEVEARLTEYPDVREAIVLALGNGQDKRLVAYVAAPENNELASQLHRHLRAILPDYMVPSAFVRLDAFPLTPNGKLDHRALPAPDQSAFARQIYEAPQGETESILAAIWRELLGVERIGRHDNFFTLGGHSLLAMRMINLAAERGLICSLNNLFQFPVLAELVAEITSDKLFQWQSSAIPVRPDGTEPPLFFVPSGMDDYSYVFGLAQHIQADYPIYALPWPSINEEQVSTIEVLASKMITFMKAVQPEGPYRIYGYSSGGILAYAIAQQLLHAGETVNFLGLIDTPAPHCFKTRVDQPKLQFLAELARQSVDEHPQEIAALHEKMDELNLVQFIAAAQELELYPSNLRPDLIAKRWLQMGNYVQMVKDYQPKALAITLHQFYAMESYPQIPFVTDVALQSVTMEPSLGWEQIVPDSSLQLTSVPGDHFSLMEDSENKTVLAKTLSMALAMNCEAEAL
ncbi:amino acid adenylation domain-containing protein [Photorhabdus noenieputensis]|uniref:non-ribosomal peptide synthetase n=1 Tax=Photorhabdus noenieputensis TaxID=1208607 RepID=UPI001BD209B2|nr:non-ribosomal peptide synthetase [Photorhabdus noenieputensis]MBS9439721.1 amino acid adenylation domain-containing protein [Photorhabdus noenieputensis]MCK3667414.1 amino acid adenylation domain-containing protein [Photorhabdus noenieputensis]